MEKEFFYKNRSFSSCLLSAYQLFNKNFRSILRVTWLPVLLNALFGGLFITLNVRHAKVQAFADAHTGIYLILYVFTILACIACTIWAWTRLLSLFNGWKRRKNALRLLFLFFCNVIITTIVLTVLFLPVIYAIYRKGVAPQMFLADNWLIILVLTIVGILLTTPLVYSSMHYLFCDEARYLKGLPKTYATGLRHLGFIIITLFLTGIITGIISLLISLPQIILSMAQTVSAIGVLQGDPDGMPGYFLALHGSTSAMTTFLLFYLSTFEFLVAIFMYGSIEKQREERRSSLISEAMASDALTSPMTTNDRIQ